MGLIFVLVAGLCLFPVFLMVLLFWGYHTLLVLTNQTSVEYHINQARKRVIDENYNGNGPKPKLKHIYNLGFLHNIRCSLGKNPLLWLLPFGELDLPHDGIRYQTLPLEEVLKQQSLYVGHAGDSEYDSEEWSDNEAPTPEQRRRRHEEDV